MNKKMRLSSFLILSIVFFLSSCVKNEVTNITLNNSTVSLSITQQVLLNADVKGTGDITKIPVTWSTSNSSVVTVIDGKLLGVSNGKAIITAQSGKVNATCEVTVDNTIVPVLNEGVLLYYGDTLKTKTSNLFIVGLAGPSDTLYFYANASLSVTNNLPDGNYKFLTTINSVTDLIPFSIIWGELYNGYEYDSWYYGKIKSPIYSGNVITTQTNNIYNIEFNITDAYGNNIIGSYQGLLNFKNATLSSAPATLIKGWSKIKQLQELKSLFTGKKTKQIL